MLDNSRNITGDVMPAATANMKAKARRNNISVESIPRNLSTEATLTDIPLNNHMINGNHLPISGSLTRCQISRAQTQMISANQKKVIANGRWYHGTRKTTSG